ncbi:MAG: phenylalanine--tRNA ligase subunit beta, partial [Dehalococcoidales bacterium]
MKVPISWLKEYVDITLPVTDLAKKLTMAGFEVEGIEVTGSSWENVVIGQVTAINPHPNADRLTLPTVDLGAEQANVVCGAPNLKIGVKVAFARVGAQLIDANSGQLTTLKGAKIRGIASGGMLCSEKELGISDSHLGILILPDDAPIGTTLADYMGDVILDVDVTPNRPDCLSIIGIAREIAALTGQVTHIPEPVYKESPSTVDQQITVEITAPDLSPRYCASLITGIKVAESPGWMQQRLLACGMRPINNVVDITNYVMLEHGQPLHSFDYEKIMGNKIIVRRAIERENFETLDGVKRTLNTDTLIIADGERSVAIGGVMGGGNSEVVEGTTSVLLEAANFNPASIHYTGRTLGLPSEACMRFERGISPGLTLPALKRATQLLVELGGGEAARGVIDAYPGKLEQKSILLSTVEVKRVLGVGYSLEQISDALTSLGFECRQSGSEPEVLVTAPYWRSDINLAVDLIEEVARIIGYEWIPVTMLSQPIPRQIPQPVIDLKREMSRLLISFGFQEIITYSLTGLELLEKLLIESHPVDPVPLHLLNPMSVEQEYLRPNLRANLLAALAANRRHEDGGIRLFELGKIYLPQPDDLPDEREVLCGLLIGPGVEKSWQSSVEPADFFEAKGVIEGLLSHLGVIASYEPGSDESLRSDRQALITVGSSRLGVVGELHHEVLDRFDIDEPAYLFEIDLKTLLPFTLGYKMFHSVARFPAIIRDMALVLDNGIAYQKIVDIIKTFPLVEQVEIFDVYSGEQVSPGKKSLAYRVIFQTMTHTLTDEEVNKVERQILDRLS